MYAEIDFNKVSNMFKSTKGDKQSEPVCNLKNCIYGDKIYYVRHKNKVIKYGLEIHEYDPDFKDMCNKCRDTKKVYKIINDSYGKGEAAIGITLRNIMKTNPLSFLLDDEEPVYCPTCKGKGTNGIIIRKIKIYYPILVSESDRGWFKFYDHEYWEQDVYGKCETCKGKGYIWKKIKKTKILDIINQF